MKQKMKIESCSRCEDFGQVIVIYICYNCGVIGRL